MSNVSEWSTTAASNNAASPNGAPEGMEPSGLNDTIREIMAALAKWYLDTQGALVAGGTANALTLTTNNVHATLADQSILVFLAASANTAAATLNVDSLGAKAIVDSAGNALTGGEITADCPVVVIYRAASTDYRLIGVRKKRLMAARVHKNGTAQASVVTSTATKVTFSTLEVDPGSTVLSFDDANDRLTPKIARKWLFRGQIGMAAIADGARLIADIRKNGAATPIAEYSAHSGAATNITSAVGVIADADGSTDYFELFGTHSHGSDKSFQGEAQNTFFEAIFLGA